MSFPFAGFGLHRPYPTTGMTTARWATEVDPVWIPFSTIILTQDGVNVLPLFGITDRQSDLYPHVVRYRQHHFLEDGHHRVIRAAITGETGMLMRVLDAPQDHW